jgi:fibronectin type III domain protein
MRLQKRTTALITGAASIVIGAAVMAVSTIPVLWMAGGLDSGTTGAGQAARMTADASGNVAIVSGPALSRDLGVTSYTSDGTFRWRRTITPAVGTFTGDWIAASPDGNFVVVGHNVTSSGSPIGITMVRYTSDGTLLWRQDVAGTAPRVGRLLIDNSGNSYLVFNSIGDGQDIRLQKHSPAGDLLWSQQIATGFFANDVATSAALSADGADLVVTGNIVGGATWITAAFDASTGTRRWLVTAGEGISARDITVDASRVYVTGQGFTGAGTPALTYWLTVVAYDRIKGTRLWRRDLKPADAGDAAGLRMALAPNGNVVVAGQTNRGFLDWYTVSLRPTGTLDWEAVRDGGLNTNEIPAAVFMLADGTAVVTGPGGPNLPGGFIPGVTAGYSANGTPVWEAFARMATVWGTALPNGDVCATGGYDALITCWRPVGGPVIGVRPEAPTALAAAAIDRRSIELTWVNGAIPQTAVQIERCTGSGCTNFTQVTSIAGTATTFTDGSLAPRTSYTYRVRAVNESGPSPYSNTASARTGR